MYDFTYVENVAHAHVCAERALASGGTVSKRAAGEVKHYYLFCFYNNDFSGIFDVSTWPFM